MKRLIVKIKELYDKGYSATHINYQLSIDISYGIYGVNPKLIWAIVEDFEIINHQALPTKGI